MLQTQEKIPYVNSSTLQVKAYLGKTGCNCTCVNCQNCVDCTSCPGLRATDVTMMVYRKGVKPEPSYFVQYSGYQLGGPNLPANLISFYVDSLLTHSPPGYYVGDIFVRGNACGSIQMYVGDNCNVFSPFTA